VGALARERVLPQLLERGRRRRLFEREVQESLLLLGEGGETALLGRDALLHGALDLQRERERAGRQHNVRGMA